MQQALDKSQSYTRSTATKATVTLRKATIRKWLLTLLMLQLHSFSRAVLVFSGEV